MQSRHWHNLFLRDKKKAAQESGFFTRVSNNLLLNTLHSQLNATFWINVHHVNLNHLTFAQEV